MNLIQWDAAFLISKYITRQTDSSQSVCIPKWHCIDIQMAAQYERVNICISMLEPLNKCIENMWKEFITMLD